MHRSFSMFGLAVLLLLANSGQAPADSKTGEVKFAAVNQVAAKVALGEKLKLTAEFKLIEVGKLAAVSVVGQVKNTANVRMHYSYNVAFMDKDKNLIGCQNFIVSVEGGKQNQAGTFIQLPRDQITRIAYYSVAFHESDQPIGEK